MNKKYILTLIVFLACVLRFWQLGANPSSLDWDEASLGYNAYSILKTGNDEYGSFLPFSIRSFGDFKPPLYTYLTIIPVWLFGLTEFATRFASAFFGILAVPLCYLLVRQLFPARSYKLALLSSFFLAVSPWHIQFSRIAFEANVGVFFFILGVFFFAKAQRSGFFYVFSFLAFVLSMYSYHSPRLVVPLFLIGASLIFFRSTIRQWKWILLAGSISIVLLFPIIRDITSGASARFGSVTVLNPSERLGKSIKAMEEHARDGDYLGVLLHNRRIVYGRDILAGYLDHFNFDFLFLTGDAPGRHHAAGMGMLYWWDLPFIIIGFVVLARHFLAGSQGSALLMWWFLVSPAASAFTTGTPHAVRALLYLPTYQIFVGLGVLKVWNWLSFRASVSESRNLLQTKVGMSKIPPFRFASVGMTLIFFGLIFNVYYYLVMYYIHTPVEYATEWQYGYKQAVETVSQYEDQFEKVIVTYRYDQPYVYFLFYNQIDPAWYQSQLRGGEIQRFNRDFGKYEFRNIEWDKDSQLTNTLLVGTPKEIPDDVTGKIKDIPFPDGTVAFRIVGR